MIIIKDGNETETFEEIKDFTEKYTKKQGLGSRDEMHINLVMEEMMEITRLSGNVNDRCFNIDGDGHLCALTMELTPGTLQDISFESLSGVSQKLKVLLGTSFETVEMNEKAAEEIGVRRADKETLLEMDCEDVEEAYLWTLDSYNMASFNKYIDGDEEDWVALSASILSALTKEVRVLILKGCILFSVILDFDSKAGEKKSYGISPEFAALSKVPVVKTRFQVKLVELMYKGLPKKVTAPLGMRLDRFEIPVPTSTKGQIETLVYVPFAVKDKKDAPVILFLHGGANLFPALPYHYKLAENLAKKTGCKVMLPMYDLAPYRQPPVQIKETFEVYTELQNNPEKYAIDPGKIFVIGDSAGGTMAAAITLLARDKGLKMPKGTLLLYPSLDMRFKTDSMNSFSDVPVINGDSISAIRKIVHSDREEGLKYHYSPAEVESLSGLCPMYVETAEFDALHDEGVEFAKRLKEQGNVVTLNETRGTVHAFDMAKDSSIQRAAVDARADFIKGLLN
ncbi:Acetyl esterase/lipase [Oribacterium sp. KHPX15]|uniref:alpha/beta hydrolase n=1 Tax=unclassified Oribacterium TaxID=2629782 RepID=UPI0004E12364|nr:MULTISPECIES: alpha/beta hydrolase [unclassified Oribacterium]SDZ79129.1 Acetyl esterase/lipase [Oribacterium sp. KHPX15]